MFDNNFLKFGGIGLAVFSFVDIIGDGLRVFTLGADGSTVITMGMLTLSVIQAKLFALLPLFLSVLTMWIGLHTVGCTKNPVQGRGCLWYGIFFLLVYAAKLVLSFTADIPMGWLFGTVYPALAGVIIAGGVIARKETESSRPKPVPFDF